MEEKDPWKGAERRRVKRVVTDTTQRHLEQLTKQARALTGEDISEPENFSLETARSRLIKLQQRHAQLLEKLTSGSEKPVARLRQEFEDAQAEWTSVCDLDGESWNDGVIATLREQVHREVEMSSLEGINDVYADSISRQHVSGIVYRVAGKTICGLRGGRIGIQFNTSFSGQAMESYFCVLSSKSFLEKMHVSDHTIPFFLPLHETEKAHLSSSATKFIDCIGDLLQGFVSRREQVRLFKGLEGIQLKHFYHSVPYTMIESMLEEPNCKVTVSITYDDLNSDLPTQSKILAWPLVSAKTLNRGGVRKGNKAPLPPPISYRLPNAEAALGSKMLHQAYEDILADLRSTLGHILPSVAVLPVASGS